MHQDNHDDIDNISNDLAQSSISSAATGRKVFSATVIPVSGSGSSASKYGAANSAFRPISFSSATATFRTMTEAESFNNTLNLVDFVAHSQMKLTGTMYSHKLLLLMSVEYKNQAQLAANYMPMLGEILHFFFKKYVTNNPKLLAIYNEALKFIGAYKNVKLCTASEFAQNPDNANVAWVNPYNTCLYNLLAYARNISGAMNIAYNKIMSAEFSNFSADSLRETKENYMLGFLVYEELNAHMPLLHKEKVFVDLNEEIVDYAYKQQLLTLMQDISTHNDKYKLQQMLHGFYLEIVEHNIDRICLDTMLMCTRASSNNVHQMDKATSLQTNTNQLIDSLKQHCTDLNHRRNALKDVLTAGQKNVNNVFLATCRQELDILSDMELLFEQVLLYSKHIIANPYTKEDQLEKICSYVDTMLNVNEHIGNSQPSAFAFVEGQVQSLSNFMKNNFVKLITNMHKISRCEFSPSAENFALLEKFRENLFKLESGFSHDNIVRLLPIRAYYNKHFIDMLMALGSDNKYLCILHKYRNKLAKYTTDDARIHELYANDMLRNKVRKHCIQFFMLTDEALSLLQYSTRHGTPVRYPYDNGESANNSDKSNETSVNHSDKIKISFCY